MIGVDTNVLVYAHVDDDPRRGPCRSLLEGAQDEAAGDGSILCLTWSVVYEFLRVVTHRSALQHPLRTSQAWSFVTALQAMPHVRFLGPGPNHADHAARMLSAAGVHGNLVHDAHIAAVLAEHGVRRIYTFDQHFRRFPGLEVVDPLG